jgi:starch synthase
VQVVNIMKGALLAADSIVTVSETYAWEITRPEHGVGLHTILHARRNRLVGILNGMDTVTWDPAKDVYLPFNYSSHDLSGKARCKAALRRKLGLPEPEYGVDVPLLGFIGRLDPQKGPDIIISALSGLLSLDCQVRLRHPRALRLVS